MNVIHNFFKYLNNVVNLLNSKKRVFLIEITDERLVSEGVQPVLTYVHKIWFKELRYEQHQTDEDWEKVCPGNYQDGPDNH